jgi:bifunctional DNA-binding transcriptional regulator/antitoxin component of YhaV-PrlF toxin-antitoxin module
MYATITSQGQISIPVKLRRKLGFDKTRRVKITVENNTLKLEPAIELEELIGVFKDKELETETESEAHKQNIVNNFKAETPEEE